MTADLKSIIVLLATQAMINMGEIQDPLTGESKKDLQGATMFIKLVDTLEKKTKGNLTPDEMSFLSEIKENLDKVYNKKFFSGN